MSVIPKLLLLPSASPDTRPLCRPGSPQLLYEMTRLRNEIKSKEKELGDKMLELRAVKAALTAKDSALEEAESQLTIVREKQLDSESQAASLKKALSDTRGERDRLKAEFAAAQREADRLNAALLSVNARSVDAVNGATDDVGRMQTALSAAKKETCDLSAENASLRKEIGVRDLKLADYMEKLEASMHEAMVAHKDHASLVTSLRKEQADRDEELGHMGRMMKLKEAEAADYAAEAARVKEELESTTEYLSGVMTELSVTQDAFNNSRVELSELKERIARLSAARRSVGSDGGAVIPMSRHVSEIKAAQAEATRLRSQLEQADSSVASARAQRDGLYARVDALAYAAGGSQTQKSQVETPTAIESPDISTLIGSPTALLSESKSQVADLRLELAGKDGTATVLARQGEAAWKHVLESRLEAAKLRRRLWEVLGEESFFSEFGETEAPSVDEDLEKELVRAQASEAQQAQRTADEMTSMRVKVESLRQKLNDATLQVEEAAKSTPQVAAAAAAEAQALVSVLEQEKTDFERKAVALEDEVVGLKQQVEALKEQLSSFVATEEDEGDEEEGHSAEEDKESTPALHSARERQRNQTRHWQGEGIPWFSGGNSDPSEAAGMTPHSLAQVLEKILAQRAGSKKKGKGGPALDEELYEEATAMLRAELARLGRETIEKVSEADRLRSEIGELQTSKLSAQAMAARLDELNEMSQRVAGLKMEIARRESLYARREQDLLREIDQLKNKKKGTGKLIKKRLSAAAKNVQKGIENAGAAVESAVMAAQERVSKGAVSPSPGEHSPEPSSMEKRSSSSRFGGGLKALSGKLNLGKSTSSAAKPDVMDTISP